MCIHSSNNKHMTRNKSTGVAGIFDWLWILDFKIISIIIKTNYMQDQAIKHQLKILMLFCIITLNSVKADLPIHCTRNQIIGLWELKIISKSAFKTQFYGRLKKIILSEYSHISDLSHHLKSPFLWLLQLYEIFFFISLVNYIPLCF